jgi:hypothetical protein
MLRSIDKSPAQTGAVEAGGSSGLDLDSVLSNLGGTSPVKSTNTMDTMLYGVNEEIEINRQERQIHLALLEKQAEQKRLQAEEKRLQAEIVAEQKNVSDKLRKKALEEKQRQEEESSGGFGRALFGAALGYTVGQVAGLDSVASVNMASEYMQAVYNNDPSQIQAASERITNDYIDRRRGEIKALQQQQNLLTNGGPSGSVSSAGGHARVVAKPAQMPAICNGYTRENYKAGRIVGDPQIDTHCQAAMHYYDMYAANVGDSRAKPDQLEKAYQNHLKAVRVIETYTPDTKSTARAQLE